MRTHTGVKKYQCLTCGKSFAYLNVLKNHELIHAGVKNYACHLCDAKFVQPYNLKVKDIALQVISFSVRFASKFRLGADGPPATTLIMVVADGHLNG